MLHFRQLLSHVKAHGNAVGPSVTVAAMGRTRVFVRLDLGKDTFILERGINRHLSERPSVTVVEKFALDRHSRGRVLTVSTGNHAVAVLPLLDGRFWGLSHIRKDRRSATLATAVLCANVVDGALELSQREVPLDRLIRLDGWLVSLAGLGLDSVVLADRNLEALEHYRRLGQEWRFKPLAWTESGMRAALAASRKSIGSTLRYYHSARGVHLLTFAEFSRFAALAESDLEKFVQGLRELVSVYEGNLLSLVRQPKYRGHHEIEIFGIRRGMAIEQLVPRLERLMEGIALERIGRLGIIQSIQEIVEQYRSLLANPDLADERTRVFIETIYMYVTGEVYSLRGEGTTKAFDDRRTALPGATFRNGHPEMHPGADVRTEILLSNLRDSMSKDEAVEYANVYELRDAGEESPALGRGSTREIVYKTNRRPLEDSLVQKRLSRGSRGYSAYMLSRIGALRALGIALSDRYLLLKRRSRKGGPVDYYIRSRCEGEPMNAIPVTYFRVGAESVSESQETVLGVALAMGDAAAQNLAMKKYDPKTRTPLFGIGKEILQFEYDLNFRRLMPTRVSVCSIRGSFGWPCLDHTEANLDRMNDFYFGHYLKTLRQFHAAHSQVAMEALAERFMNGFEFRTRALAWRLSVMRDRFVDFAPEMPARYRFVERWKFLMWSLERQEQRLAGLRRKFLEKSRMESNEDLRNHSEPLWLESFSR